MRLTSLLLRLGLLGGGLALLLPLSGCGGGDDTNASGFSGGTGPRVVATTTMLADLVREVGGDRVQVAGLMGPGVDPHLYKASTSDVNLLKGADLIVANGHFLEGRMTTVLEQIRDQGTPVVFVAESIPESGLIRAGGEWDPHIWFSPGLWARAATVVAEALTQVAPPEDHEQYLLNANAFGEMARDLHDWARQELASIPPEQRVLITSHDAFNYFGETYLFGVVGVQGLSTASEAGLADMTAMVAEIADRGVKAVFVESSVATNSIERIAQDANVEIGGTLFSDATGPVGETLEFEGERVSLGTWRGMFIHNVRTIADALGN